jgi:hypothetical protein
VKLYRGIIGAVIQVLAVNFVVTSTVSIVLQMAVLALLAFSLSMKSKKKFRLHGTIMLVVVLLHLSSIFLVMVPSLIGFVIAPEGFNVSNATSALTLVHASAGISAAALGIGLVSAWRLNIDVVPCFKRKRIMDVTFALWLIAIAIGVYLYLVIIQAI